MINVNVDKVFVLSVREATERRKNMIKEWEGIDTQFVINERQNNPKKGCFESHINLIKESKERGYSKILILEDDARMVPPNREELTIRINESLKWLDNNKPSWKYFLLGFFPVKSKRTKNPHIFNLKCTFLAHAYIVNLKNIETPLPTWKGRQIDNVLFCNNLGYNDKGIYGAHPMLVLQEGMDSYINILHADFQDKVLHKIGQDKLANVSCIINIMNFMFLSLFIIILTIPLIVLNVVYPGTTALNVFFIFYIILLFISILMVFII